VARDREPIDVAEARRQENEARAAFIRAALTGNNPAGVIDGLRLDWVRAGEALDRLLALRATEPEFR
jgi:hypothetical protein